MSEKPSFDKKPSFLSAVWERVFSKKPSESGETSRVVSVVQSVKNAYNRIMDRAKEYVPSSPGNLATIGALAGVLTAT